MVNSYASELLTVVNEPIYNGHLYILYLKCNVTNCTLYGTRGSWRDVIQNTTHVTFKKVNVVLGCCFEISIIMRHWFVCSNLTPKVVWRSVAIPLTTKIVPISSLSPTVSVSIQKFWLRMKGMDSVGPAAARKCCMVS